MIRHFDLLTINQDLISPRIFKWKISLFLHIDVYKLTNIIIKSICKLLMHKLDVKFENLNSIKLNFSKKESIAAC